MDALNWRLFFVWLCFNVVQTEGSSWTIDLPSTVKGHPGSCVVIHCSYNYPDDGKKATQFTGIWYDAADHVVYHPVKSKIAQQYRDRTELLGDIEHKNCSLKIDPLQQSDQGPFVFRIEMANFDHFSYLAQVSITMMDKVDVAISLTEDLVEGQLVVAYCSVSPSCPTSLPVFRWNHPGEEHFHSLQFDDDQWKATAALSFRPTSADHNKALQCTAHYSGGQQQKTSKLLKVKHAPVNVRVEYKSDVKEGEAVQLTCTSDAHPPASSYEWSSETGAQLHQGNIYTMPNVSRHLGALYCTAINTVGRGKSSPVRLTVLYAPVNVRVEYKSDVKEGEAVQLTCTSDAHPPASSYEWSSETGAQLHQGNIYTMPNVSRHLGALYCTAINTVGRGKSSPVRLTVLYAPVNVRVEYKSDVKEGEAVQLTCTSDAHPPASSYEWSSETGAQLHQGNIYTMPNVSRHLGALYCTAINTVGRGKSSPVRLTVLYAPEIKSLSSCSSEGTMVKCVCIADSEPPCMVHFVLSEGVLPGTKIERHGSVTIGTLQAEFESSEFVHCLANNTVGNASLVLSLPGNGAMQSLYIAIAIGAGALLVILLIAVGLVKKCRGTSGETPTPHMSDVRENKEELTECATVKRKDMNYKVVTRPTHDVDEHVYGNVEPEWDEAIYANV